MNIWHLHKQANNEHILSVNFENPKNPVKMTLSFIHEVFFFDPLRAYFVIKVARHFSKCKNDDKARLL